MILAQQPRHSHDYDFHGGETTDRRIIVAIVTGVIGISVLMSLLALADLHLGAGPVLAPVAYVFVTLCAAILWVTFLAPFLSSETTAGFILIGAWAITLAGAVSVFRYLG